MSNVIPFPQVPRPTMRFTNAADRPFYARLLMPGARFGKDDGLHVKVGDGLPMIEFWDATYEHDARFTPGLGQFTGASYYVDTFLAHRGALALDAGVDVWTIDAGNVVDVITWLTGRPAIASAGDAYPLGDCHRYGGHLEAIPFPGHCVVCGRGIAGDAPTLS